jgi:RimJ/RimL family protein N-acetyltransferase
MHLVRPDAALLRQWLDREQPGPTTIIGHVVGTGHGRCWVDRPAAPAAVLVETAGNYRLSGAASAVDPASLRPLVNGFVSADHDVVPLLGTTFPGSVRVDRVIYASPSAEPGGSTHDSVRRLTPHDAGAVDQFGSLRWVAKTWDGPTGLAGGGHAWGAFEGGRLVSVACSFFVGVRYEEIGVVTLPAYRGRGLSTSCVRALCADITARGRIPSWTTSTDNLASRRVAEKVGLRYVGDDVLYAIGVSAPS